MGIGNNPSPSTGRGPMLDKVRLALERVRSGVSDFEEIGLPSGACLTIHADESSPIGVRIQTPMAPGKRRLEREEVFTAAEWSEECAPLPVEF